jgi:hypothetical protein
MPTSADDPESDENDFLVKFDDTIQQLRARHQDCPRPDLLRSANAGAVPSALATSIAVHVAGCAMCQRLLDDLDDHAVDALTDVERQRIHRRVFAASGRRDRRTIGAGTWWVATATAAAIAASIVLTSIIPAAEPPQLPPAPALRVAAGVPARSVLELDKPALKLPVAAMLSLRAAPQARIRDIQDGLRLYREDDFRSAAARLERVAPTASLPQLGLYLGVSYLYLGDHLKAERTLSTTRPLVAEAMQPEVTWYLALAHVRAGQMAAARDELDGLCRGQSEFAGRACAGSLELAGASSSPR